MGSIAGPRWKTTTDPKTLGVLGLLSGTVLVAIIAVTIAVPMAVCAALFIVEYASPRGRSYLTALVDLPPFPVRLSCFVARTPAARPMLDRK